VLIAWGIASFGIGGANVAEVFLAKDTFNAGDFGYGLLFSSIGVGLVIGSFASSTIVERIGTAKTYGGGLFVMALGFAGAAASPNVWVAAVCCIVAGIGDGAAIVCNALLVQRGAEDAMRGRALTLVMSATYVLTAIGSGLAGGLEHVGPRWFWAGAAVCFLVGGGAGWLLARDRGRVEIPLEATAH